MSRTRATIAFDLDNMVAGKPGESVAHVIYKSEDGILQAYGTSAPSAVAGYAEGCIFHVIDASGGATLYVNEGDDTTSDFNLVISEDNISAQAASLITAANAGTIIDTGSGNVTPANANEIVDRGFPLATTAGTAGPSPLLWDGVPLLDLMLDPTLGYYLMEDFNKSLLASDVGATLTQNTGGATFTNNPAVAGGVGVLDAAATTNDHAGTLSFLGMQCKPAPGTHIVFEARVKIGVDTGGFIIGLFDDSATDVLTASIVTNSDHACFFRDEGMGDTAVGTQACDGTGITTASDTIADSDIAEFETWGIHILGDGDTVGDYVKFYHEGVLVATVVDADQGGNDGIPDAIICPTFVVDNMGDSVQSKLSIDWMRVACWNATAGTARA